MRRPVCQSMSLMERVLILEVRIQYLSISLVHKLINGFICSTDLKLKSKNVQKSHESSDVPSPSTETPISNKDTESKSTESSEPIDTTNDEQNAETQSESKKTNEKSTTLESDCSSSGEKNDSDSCEQKLDSVESTSKIADDNSDDNLIEVEDPDDYLLYLETILLKIHSRFYAHYNETKQVNII